MKLIIRLSTWCATLMVPIILILVAVRITLSPIFIQIEYHLPGFPEDPYGFTLEDRLYWANLSRLYLLNTENIKFLSDLRLDDQTPLYNERELQHMVDVKAVVRGAMLVLVVALLVEFVIWYMSHRLDEDPSFFQAISRGGWITVILIVSILVYLAFNFNSLFTNFHLIFFEGDTWLFRYSDSLIRLFPIRFWRDAFIWISVMGLLSGLSLGYFFSKSRGS